MFDRVYSQDSVYRIAALILFCFDRIMFLSEMFGHNLSPPPAYYKVDPLIEIQFTFSFCALSEPVELAELARELTGVFLTWLHYSWFCS